MKLSYCLMIILCLFLTACASSGYYSKEGQQMSSARGQGDSYNIGMRYMLGQGVSQDYSRAKSLFEDAASQNNPYAENELGYMYMAGLGVGQDYTKAFQWYQRAADHGLPSAQYSLGTMYTRGLGTPVDKVAAREWFQKAASSGFSPARAALANA